MIGFFVCPLAVPPPFKGLPRKLGRPINGTPALLRSVHRCMKPFMGPLAFTCTSASVAGLYQDLLAATSRSEGFASVCACVKSVRIRTDLEVARSLPDVAPYRPSFIP